MKTRILMLVPSAKIKGSIPKITPLLVEALREHGCEVTTHVWGKYQDKETLKQKIAGRLKDIINIRKILLKERPDVLIVNTAHDWATLSRDIPLLLAARQICCTVNLLHGSQPNLLVNPGNGLFKWVTKWLIHLSDATLVLSSEEQRQWLQFFPSGKFYVVTNPFVPPAVETNKAFDLPWNIPPEKPVLLFAGRLIREKGVFELLDAMTSVNAQMPCHLIIAGDGPRKQQVRQQIAELGLGKCVTLAGYLNGAQMSGAYHQANVFVLPTYHDEGFPTVISEAMSVGLPIVTTCLRGSADCLIEGTNALFVPPRNSMVLANTIVKLLNDSDLCTRMGMANKEKVKDFAPDVVGRQYLNVFQDVIKKKSHLK